MKRVIAKVLVFSIILVTIGSFAASLGFAEESGPKEALVKAVVIKGNENVDTAIVQAAISRTKIDEVVAEQNILDDLRTIYDLGYFSDVHADLEEAPGGIKVVFSVIENPVVNDIEFKGSSLKTINEFKPKMQVQKGEVFNVKEILDDLKLLPDWALMEHGVALRPSDLQITEEGIVHIGLTDTTIKDIVIEGNQKTKDFVIERELSIKPGDTVNMGNISRDLRRVLMLGYFDEINREFVDGDNPDQKVLRISVKERKTGSATFGLAYSSQEGIVGFVEAADENFLGRGQRVNATLQLGRKVQSYELGFFEPYIERGGTSLGVNVYKRDTNVTKSVEVGEVTEKLSGKRNVIGGDITLGRPFTEFTRGRLILKAQNISYETSDDTDPALWYQDYNTRTVGLGVVTNTTDHPLNPTEGFKNDISLELGTAIFGGDSTFSKAQIEHSRFYEIKDGGYVFAFRGIGGKLLSGQFEENEKFRVGGAESIRGFVPGGDESLIGDKMFVLNAEFRFPIVDKVQGVLFADLGRAWKDEESMGLDDLNRSYGLGVRLDTPLGLLRLDYGLGKGQDGESKGQFYFGVGQTF